MKYVNAQTGLQIDLVALTDVEREFYSESLKKFYQNTNWLAFDDFAFGMQSPIYHSKRSHLEVLKSSLYLALKDMSLQLGVQQGMIARKGDERDRKDRKASA